MVFLEDMSIFKITSEDQNKYTWTYVEIPQVSPGNSRVKIVDSDLNVQAKLITTAFREISNHFLSFDDISETFSPSANFG
jgi:hypothetical protein